MPFSVINHFGHAAAGRWVPVLQKLDRTGIPKEELESKCINSFRAETGPCCFQNRKNGHNIWFGKTVKLHESAWHVDTQEFYRTVLHVWLLWYVARPCLYHGLCVYAVWSQKFWVQDEVKLGVSYSRRKSIVNMNIIVNCFQMLSGFFGRYSKSRTAKFKHVRLQLARI